jgi:hypothetical protein
MRTTHLENLQVFKKILLTLQNNEEITEDMLTEFEIALDQEFEDMMQNENKIQKA